MPDPLLQPIDLDKLPATVRMDIAAYYAETGTEVPENMTVLDALHAFLFWNGILGWTSSIADIVRSTKS